MKRRGETEGKVSEGEAWLSYICCPAVVTLPCFSCPFPLSAVAAAGVGVGGPVPEIGAKTGPDLLLKCRVPKVTKILEKSGTF